MPTTLQGIESLSERQKEVLRLTAKHMAAKEVARTLNITERTVRAHTESARQRLGAATSREAVRILLAHEADQAIGRNDQWASPPIAEAAAGKPGLGHEQTLHPPTASQRNHDDQLQSSGVSLENARLAQQAGTYPGRDRHFEDTQPDLRAREGTLQSGRGDSVSDGRWGQFRRRLKTLPAIQVLGLIVIAALLLVLIAGMFAGTLLGMVEVVHKLTIYAGWKS